MLDVGENDLHALLEVGIVVLDLRAIAHEALRHDLPPRYDHGGRWPCRHGRRRVSQLILSRNSSSAFPTRSSLRVSTTVRFGLATYQASAVIWYLTIQSL